MEGTLKESNFSGIGFDIFWTIYLSKMFPPISNSFPVELNIVDFSLFEYNDWSYI
jgi:hypothetical protein